MLARAARASLELYHAIDAPLPSASLQWDMTRKALERYVDETLATVQGQMERFKRSPLLRGLRVRCHVDWDYPPHEAIVRRAMAIRADLLIAATRHRGFAGRLLLRNTDWELIRQCPCPLLLVKSSRGYESPVILAAVDPFHAHAKPARLDALVLNAGATMAALFGGSVHVFHAYMPLINVMPTPAGAGIPMGIPPEAEEAHRVQIARVFNQLAKAARIPAPCRHLLMGSVPSELTATVRSTGARIVVMGAVSRSGLKRLFIGSTAERALDSLRCDVLVVKPRGFKSGVTRRPALSSGRLGYVFNSTSSAR